MDPFWGITLSLLAISKFWKSERGRTKDKKTEKQMLEDKIEQEKQKAVIAKYTAVFSEPMSKEEKESEKLEKEIEKQREKDIEELRKQGFTDELITTIIPTINNGQ